MDTKPLTLLILSGLVLAAEPAPPVVGLRLSYLGHACFLIEDANGNRVLTDPFLDGYPLPFPRRLSVDMVAVGTPESGHDAAYQLRGNPAVLAAQQASASLGATKVDGLQVSGSRMAYLIRSGAFSVLFVGEWFDGELSPDLRQALETADVVLAAPAHDGPLVGVLASRKKPVVLVPLEPDRLTGSYTAEYLQRFLGEASNVLPVTEAAALEVREGMKPGIVRLKKAAQPVEGQDRSIFRDTMAEMTWRQVQLAAQAGALVLLPVGVIEEHGPHMGLAADTYLAYWHAVGVRRALGAKGIKAVVAPPVYWGLTDDTSDFPGSFNVRPETMASLLGDILGNLNQWGFRRVFCMNFHGNRNQGRVLSEAVAASRSNLKLDAYDLRRLEVPLAPLFPRGRADAFRPDYHSGAVETRVMAEGLPEDVDTRLANRLQPQNGFRPLGYAGDPASWTKEEQALAVWEASAVRDAERIALVLEKSNDNPRPAGEAK